MAPAGIGGPYEPRRILQSIAHQNPLSFILTMRSTLFLLSCSQMAVTVLLIIVPVHMVYLQ